MSGAKSALWNDETMTDEFVKQAKAFVAENWEKPFFLYFASQCIQVPRAPRSVYHPLARAHSAGCVGCPGESDRFPGCGAALLEQEAPQGATRDSRNQVPALLGQSGGACVNDRGVLFPGAATGGVEMRRETGKSWSGPAHPASLYYLAEDSSEATDLIQLHPERAEAMTEKLRTMKDAKKKQRGFGT